MAHGCEAMRFLYQVQVLHDDLAAIHRCREGRENRSQLRCGIGSQFHNVAVSDDGQAKPIGATR